MQHMCHTAFSRCILIFQERDMELAKEAQRQEENDKLRKEFAKHANAFHQLLTDTRYGYFDRSSTLSVRDILTEGI